MIKRELQYGSILCYTAVITSILLYGLPFDEYMAYIVRIAAICLVLLLLAVRVIHKAFYVIAHWGETEREEKRHLYLRSFVFFGSIVIGLLILGNMAVDNPLTRGALAFLGRIVGDINVLFLPPFIGEEVVRQTGSFAVGDYRELGWFNQYNRGLTQFVSYYGGIMAMILAVNYLFKLGAMKYKNLSWSEFVLYEIFLICAGSIPCFLFFMDFIDYGSRAWLKSRFLEIPVYLIIFVFLYCINRFSNRWQRVVFSTLLVVYVVLPFIVTERFTEIVDNWRIFLYLLRM